MTTRNEWIAERFAVWLDRPTFKTKAEASLAVASLMDAADAIEAAGCAPWIDDDAAPALPDAAANVVEAAIQYDAWLGDPLSEPGAAFHAAVAAYKESVK